MTAWLSQLISPNSSRWWQAAFAQVCDCFAVLHFCFFCKEFPSCFAHRILAPEKTVRWILEASDCPLLLSSLCRLPKVACKQGNPHLAANVVGKIGDLRAPEAFTQWAVNVDSYWCWIPHCTCSNCCCPLKCDDSASWWFSIWPVIPITVAANSWEWWEWILSDTTNRNQPRMSHPSISFRQEFIDLHPVLWSKLQQV